MAELFSLWIGNALGLYEEMCLRSFVAHGHRVALYTYDEALAVPPGVEPRDAASVVPRDRIQRNARGAGKGSFAVFADLFRYAALLRDGGTWIDCDMVCNGPAVPEGEVVIGRQHDRKLCIAVLKLPRGGALTRAILEDAERHDLSAVQWSEIGATVVERHLRDAGLLDRALPKETFFPIAPLAVDRFFLPAAAGAVRAATAGSSMIHLWHERLRRYGFDKRLLPPAGSFLDEMFRRYHPEAAEGPRYRAIDIEVLAAARRRAWRTRRWLARSRFAARAAPRRPVYFEKSPVVLVPA